LKIHENADLFARMFDKPKSLKDICPAVPDELVQIIQKCIDLDHSRRYYRNAAMAAAQGFEY